MIKLDNENIVVGSANISTKPLKPFDSNVLNFLDLISKEKQMKLKEYFDKQKDLEVCLISAKNRQGTENLMKEIGYKLEKIDD